MNNTTTTTITTTTTTETVDTTELGAQLRRLALVADRIRPEHATGVKIVMTRLELAIRRAHRESASET
jgi:hypothetical protein